MPVFEEIESLFNSKERIDFSGVVTIIQLSNFLK